MRCGKCRQLDVTVEHVRKCYSARPDAEVTVEANEGNVPRRGENFFVTAGQQRMYDAIEADNRYWETAKNQYARAEQAADERVARGKMDFSVKPEAESQPRQEVPPKPASPKQIKYIEDLRERKGEEPLAFTGTSRQASEEIERLRGMPNKVRTPNYRQNDQPVAIEDGMYRYQDNIYKVIHAVHGSGFQYAKKLVRTKHPMDHKNPKLRGKSKGEFLKADGIVFKLRPEMMLPVEEALAYGKLYGVCVRCGKTLTREDSIERGMGSKCYGIMNGDF